MIEYQDKKTLFIRKILKNLSSFVIESKDSIPQLQTMNKIIRKKSQDQKSYDQSLRSFVSKSHREVSLTYTYINFLGLDFLGVFLLFEDFYFEVFYSLTGKGFARL